MKIIIETHGIRTKGKVIRLIGEKMEQLSDLNDYFIEGRISLKRDLIGVENRKICSVRITLAGTDLIAIKHARTFPAAIAKAYAAIRRQISDWKSHPHKLPTGTHLELTGS